MFQDLWFKILTLNKFSKLLFLAKRKNETQNKQLIKFNPFTAKFNQKQISTKFHRLWNCEKQIAPCDSTGRELSLDVVHRLKS